MIEAKTSPSMMCADFSNLKDQMSELEKAKVELLHMDIMDGVFVPNITLSNGICKNIRKLTTIPFDYHFMIVEPLEKLKWFEIKAGDYAAIHYEAAKDTLDSCIDYIKSQGAKAGVVISPDTEYEVLIPYLSKIDYILVMSVYPGFAGQKLIPETLVKLNNLRLYLDNNGYQNIEIEIDGNVSYENAIIMRRNGANIFVGGTSSIFRSDRSIVKGTNDLRLAIKEGE